MSCNWRIHLHTLQNIRKLVSLQVKSLNLEFFEKVNVGADKQDSRETGSCKLQKVTEEVWFSKLSKGLGLVAWKDSFPVWAAFSPMVPANQKKKLTVMNWKVWKEGTIRNIQTDSHF